MNPAHSAAALRHTFLNATRAPTFVSTDSDGFTSHAIRSNRMSLLERLADDLAHEIKNPLHSMVINLEVLKRRVTKSESGEAAELLRYVGVLDGELERVNRQLELLLSIVRPGRYSEPAPLSQLLDQAGELIELDLEKRRVVLQREPHADEMRVRLPRNRGTQLLLNLLLIALDAAAPGGAVRLSAKSDGERLRLELFATGAAVPAGSTAANSAISAAAGPHGPAETAQSNGSSSDERVSVARTLAAEVGAAIELVGDVGAIADAGLPSPLICVTLPFATRGNA